MDTNNTEARELTPPLSSNHDRGRDVSDQPKIRMSSRGGGNARDGQSMTIGGFNSKELDAMEGTLHGHNWVTVSDRGRLRVIPTFKELPGPLDDEMMLPFWRPAVMGVETQLEMFSMDSLPDYSSPSLIIQHLCGYNYTPQGYAREAKKLMSWGFECLRSRRNISGQYHELWYLMGLWAARDELKSAIDSAAKGTQLSGPKCLEAAIGFLCRNASFGTLDASNQRAAMTID